MFSDSFRGFTRDLIEGQFSEGVAIFDTKGFASLDVNVINDLDLMLNGYFKVDQEMDYYTGKRMSLNTKALNRAHVILIIMKYPDEPTLEPTILKKYRAFFDQLKMHQGKDRARKNFVFAISNADEERKKKFIKKVGLPIVDTFHLNNKNNLDTAFVVQDQSIPPALLQPIINRMQEKACIEVFVPESRDRSHPFRFLFLIIRLFVDFFNWLFNLFR